MKLLLGLSLSLFAASLSAEQPSPTKKDVPKVDKPSPPPFREESFQFYDCFKFLANPPGEQGFFANKDSLFYFLLNKGLGKGMSLSSSQWPWQLTEVNLANSKARAILSFVQSKDSIIVPSGEMLQGVTVLSFDGKVPECAYGSAAITHLSFVATSKRAVSQTGRYTTIYGADFPSFVDLSKKVIMQIDMGQFQLRPIFSVPDDVRPLYFNTKQQQFIALRKDATTVRLVKFSRGEKTPDVDVELRSDERIMIDRDRIAILRYDLAKNSMQIQLCPELFTKTADPKAKCKVIEIGFPKETPISEARVDFDAESQTMLVFGMESLTAKRWQRVFVIDLKQAKIVDTIQAKGPSYIGFTKLFDQGRKAMFEMRDANTHRTQSLLVYEIAKRSAREIGFGATKKK